MMGRSNRFTVQYPDKLEMPGPGTYSEVRPKSAKIGFTKAARMSHQSSKDVIGRNYCFYLAGQYEFRS